MFGFLGTRKRRQPATVMNRARLGLEALEARYCPSAPELYLQAPSLSGHTVQLNGQVTDSNPASVQITISGVVSGTTTADSSGYFSFVGTASEQGTISAVGVDGDGLTSNTAQTQVAVSNPTISEFQIEDVVHRNVTIVGTVTDEDPAGLTVTVSGAVSGSMVTDNNGVFSAILPASALGSIQAVVTDSWGLTSATAKVTLTAVPPDIEDFGAANTAGNWWTISGYIPGPNTQGEIVTFSGFPAVNGLTATVDSTGHFYLTLQLPANTDAAVYAYATDWWGQESNEAGTLITPTA